MNHIDHAIRELEDALKSEEAQLGLLERERQQTEQTIQKNHGSGGGLGIPHLEHFLKNSFYGVVKKREWSAEQRTAASARMKAIHAARQGASA